jgi:hypothetical protein
MTARKVVGLAKSLGAEMRLSIGGNLAFQVSNALCDSVGLELQMLVVR